MKIYICGLRYDVLEEDLKELCEEIGPVVSVSIPCNEDRTAGRGFGFVEFQDNMDALRALDDLNLKEFQGRILRVEEAREKPSSPRPHPQAFTTKEKRS